MNLPDNILPLMDGDWLLYMSCQAVEYSWEGEDTPPFEEVVNVLERKVKEVGEELSTSTPPIFFFTGHNNFRKEVATTKVYKGNRTSDKPYHYQNLRNYIEARYETHERDDCEADDLMSIYQTEWEEEKVNWKGHHPHPSTCIVTADKDLRMVNGWHYSPEGWNYGSFGPMYVTDDNSYLEMKVGGKLKGVGWKFFYSQLLTGDAVDNIPGCPGVGPVKAYNILSEVESEAEAYEAVRNTYKEYVMLPDECLNEMAQLLWMIREVDDAGALVHWSSNLMGEVNGTAEVS